MWCDHRLMGLLPTYGACPPLREEVTILYFATGIVNSAPFAIESGQRCITDL
jgi:hypothetical protein